MYVLHFSIDWGHRLHKCLRQVWYFNLFLVRGMLDLCPINTQGNGLAKISHGKFSLFCLEAEMSTRKVLLKLQVKYDCLQSKTSFLFDLEASDKNEHRKCWKSQRMRWESDTWNFFLSLSLKSNPTCLIHQSTKAQNGGVGGGGAAAFVSLRRQKYQDTLSH